MSPDGWWTLVLLCSVVIVGWAWWFQRRTRPGRGRPEEGQEVKPGTERRPQLTETQLAIIAHWAQSTMPVSEVRLFGSRARGDAREDSYVDLAVTITAGDPGNALSIYLSKSDHWRHELAALLQSHVSLLRYPFTPDEKLAAILEQDAIVIWSR